MEVVRSQRSGTQGSSVRHSVHSGAIRHSRHIKSISRGNSGEVASLLSPRAAMGHKPNASASVFDFLTHQPPRIDHKGENKETHKGRELLKRNTNNILNEKVHIPDWWTDKRIYS